MCGIAAIIGLDGRCPSKLDIKRMIDIIKHRGPDEEGIFLSGSVGFGFRRLAILDLTSTGHQPMFSQDRKKVIIFNGEIYNFIELREELESFGHRFFSSGDTEVLLKAYIHWGPSCVNKFNGMWAFLIYDLETKKIFGSRDRFGKKPLYYYKANDYFIFSSEIKCILNSRFYNIGENWRKIAEFFLENNLNQVPKSEETFFKNIYQVPESCNFEIDLSGNFKKWRYWSLPQTCSNIDDENSPKKFQQIFYDSVRLRLRSDVPLGVFLSGGLDSSSVICSVADILKKDYNNKLPSISAFSYHAKEYDESEFIDETIKRTGAYLFQFKPKVTDLYNRLKEYLWYQDEPVHSFASIIFYELCRIAKSKGIKVILAGGGADEYIAGYPPYFRSYWYSIAKSINLQNLILEIRNYSTVHDKSMLYILSDLLKLIVSNEIRKVAFIDRMLDRRRKRAKTVNSWFSMDLIRQFTDQMKIKKQGSLYFELKRSVESYPLPLYLREDDRSTMAHSIEGRSPFLDYRLVEFVFKLSDHMKTRGPWNKYILREAMKGIIPETVRIRPDKMGFSIPQKKWFSDTLYEPVSDLIYSKRFRERGIYNLTAIQNDLESQKIGEIDLSSRFFNLLQFELWSEVVSANNKCNFN